MLIGMLLGCGVVLSAVGLYQALSSKGSLSETNSTWLVCGLVMLASSGVIALKTDQLGNRVAQSGYESSAHNKSDARPN